MHARENNSVEENPVTHALDVGTLFMSATVPYSITQPLPDKVALHH